MGRTGAAPRGQEIINEVLENGKWGALVPVGDDAALAAAMETALSQNPDRAALKRRAQFFSVERAVAEYEKVLFRP